MDNSILLGVNIDHVATLRQARGTDFPDPVIAASIAEKAGADGITLHLREDRRHIQDRDVELLKKMLNTPMNLEMAATSEMVDFAVKLIPENCCIVPERREELTTEGGLDVVSQIPHIKQACERLADVGTKVSLFIDTDFSQIESAAECGASVIEIHTGHYASAVEPDDIREHLERVKKAVDFGNKLGLQVNAGHGLHYENVQNIVKIDGIVELNIGHSIICDSIFNGLENSVRNMKLLLSKGSSV